MTIDKDSLRISRPEPRAITLIGAQGIGKSTIASLIPGGVFAAAERGLSGLSKVPHWLVESYEDMMGVINYLYTEEHKFKALVLDTVTKMEKYVHAELLMQEEVASLDKVGGGWYKWRIEALPLWSQLLEGFDALRYERGIEIVILGHTGDKEVKPPDNDPYRKYTLSLLNPLAADLIYQWSDIVGFYNYKVYTKLVDEKKVSGKTKKTFRGAGTGERVMHFDERPAFYAKNRYGFPAELIISRDNHEFLELLGYAKPKAKSKK